MPSNPQRDREKQVAAAAAVDLVEDGMRLGLGTGSTVNHFLKALGKKVAAGMRVEGIPTSERTAFLARELGIKIIDFSEVKRLDLAVDGADEVDHDFRMIKGGGGALLREKIVASAADKVVIIADASKRVASLGAFPLPVEVVPFGHHRLSTLFSDMGIAHELRHIKDQPYMSDNGNFIFDCTLGRIADPVGLSQSLKSLTGVVETGLFIDLCHILITGDGERAVTYRK